MVLVQLLLPLYSNADEALPRTFFRQTREELVARFGGLTAYTRAPASGLWQEDDGSTVHDEIVIYEVMADSLDETWWCAHRKFASCSRRNASKLLLSA